MILAALVAALTFAPVGAPVGAPVVAHATQLAPNAPYRLVWHTGQAHWRVENGKFLGILAPDTTRVIAGGTSDASGALTLRFTVPEDFGYIHDVDLQSNDGVVTHQGFTIVPHLTLSPASGPAGTPITVTVTGLGYRFYQTVWHLMYDGAQTGWLSAITTHGTARVTLPASGEPGMHTLQAIEGPTAPYLNGQQSPNAQPLIPQVIAQAFRLTAGPPRLPASAVAQAPQRVTDSARDASGQSLTTNYRSGTVGSPLVITGRGFAPQASIAVDWETVVGNRLSATGWETQLRPFVHAVADAYGSFKVNAQTPDDLGGDHRVVAHSANSEQELAAAAYRIVPSIAEVKPATAAPGQTITLNIKGVGWTETANTYTVDVDNSMFGYGCGFNSQGDVTIRIRAPGRAGWHFVDIYPTIYTGQILGPGTPPSGASVNGSYFLLPMLNVVDHPGERLPAFHLAFYVRGKDMMNRKYMLGLTAAAPLAALPVRASSQDLEALYEGAKREGALSLYTGGVAANSASTVTAFNKAYPGITITVNGDYSNVTDIKIDKQLAQKKVDCDIASLQTVQDFVRWNRAGEIAPFKFSGWAGIDAEYKDPGGAFVATSLNPLAYGYNTKLVKDADVPRSALDFLKPQFRGQAITCYPHDDDATLFLFYTLERKYGTEFIQRYMATQPEFVEGHAGVNKALGSGKKMVSFDCSAHTALDLKATGAPIDVRFSAVDETPVFYNTMGIMRQAPHPNAARLFIAWFLAPAQQIASGNWSPRPDIPPPAGQKPLSSYGLAKRYKEFLVNTSLVNTQRARYLAYTGPVINRS